jgi:hypothetical protein
MQNVECSAHPDGTRGFARVHADLRCYCCGDSVDLAGRECHQKVHIIRQSRDAVDGTRH